MGSAFVSTLSLPAFPKIHDGGVEIQQHAAALPGFYSNAYLIEGAQSCALVDAHLNIDEARDLAALVATIRKPVTSIVITHPHPDHYLGLEHLGPLFPDAVIRSSGQSLNFIRTAAADWKDFKNPMLPLHTRPISLAGTMFECLAMPDAESVAPIVLYEPDSRTLVAGDHVLNGQHLWLVEGRPTAWRRNLKRLAALSPTLVLPGHGVVGGAELIGATDTYLQDFVSLREQKTSAQQLLNAMLERYPDHVFPEALQNSVMVTEME